MTTTTTTEDIGDCTLTTTPDDAAEEKKLDDAVTLVPVPDEDIIKFAKPKCGLCLGLGKLKVTAVGGADPKTLVCNCATKRFIAANSKRLAVNRDKKLFYREVPDGVAVEPESEEAEPEETGLAEDHVAHRFKVMNDRVAIIDKELTEIAERYARQLLALQNEAVQAENSLVFERSGYNRLVFFRDELTEKLSKQQAELDALMKAETNLRAKLDRDKESLARTETQIWAENSHLLPFQDAALWAKEKVEDLKKRQYRAMKPGEQRKASLLKRMSHKAASLGLSVDDIASKVST